jgi:hypothetical protein
MAIQEKTAHERRTAAQAAWEALPHGGHDRVLVQVQCARSHHVAAVYDTDIGPVYVAPVRPRSHGSRDRVDELHNDQEVTHWFDLLVVDDTEDDGLPAWCDCGPRTLSRAAIREWLAAHEARVVVD